MKIADRSMPWRWVLIAAGIAAVAAGGVAWRWKLFEHAAVRPLAVVISADTAGWIMPCGCTTNQSGGLARRATYIRQIEAEADVIVADAGGVAGGNSEYDRVKFAAILSGEQAMGLAAHNLGGSEISLGADECRRLAAGGVPLVSANTTDRNSKPIVAPLKIVAAGGRHVALVGVVSPRYATDEIQIAPAAPAVLGALHAVAGQYDSAIVLAYLPTEELESLARELPEADAVVGGPTLQSIPPQRIGPTLLTSVTNKGKFLAVLRWGAGLGDSPSDGGSTQNSGPHAAGPHAMDTHAMDTHAMDTQWSAEIVEVAEPLADDSRQLAGIRAFEKKLAALDLTPQQSGFEALVPEPLPAQFTHAGRDSCEKCHAAETHVWAKTSHHVAWRSLVEKGMQADPFCQRCHTAAYGLPGGFVSARRTPDRVDVDCESCHGPALAHVRDPKMHTPFVAREQCTRCHDRENSPQFDFDTYWPRIQHGSTSDQSATEHLR